jgi:transcriptional regulator with XRE-family HTH domain
VRTHYSIVDDLLCAALVKMRNGYGLTQREFTRRAQMHHSWLAKIESGDRYLRLDDLFSCAIALELPVGEFAGRLFASIPKRLLKPSRKRRVHSKRNITSHSPQKAGERAWLAMLASYRPEPLPTRRRRSRHR